MNRRASGTRISLVTLALAAAVAASATASGIRTHVQMCVSMLDGAPATEPVPGLRALFTGIEVRRAFFQGCMFPDWGFAAGGMHDAGETAHWQPFQLRYLAYLRSVLRQPWSDADWREVAFFLGTLAHGVQDVPAHFDAGALGRRSYLSMSAEHDRLGHTNTEKFADALVYLKYRHGTNDPFGELRRPDCNWPFKTLLAVYAAYPALGVTEAKLREGCNGLAAGYLGTAAIAELGGATAATVGSARLWLYLTARRGGPPAAKVIEAYRLNRPWQEGTARTDEVAGYAAARLPPARSPIATAWRMGRPAPLPTR